MNYKQDITVPLDEFLALKELEENKNTIEIIERFDSTIFLRVNISDENTQKLIADIKEKFEKSNATILEKYKKCDDELDAVKQMSIFEFIKYKWKSK